MLGMILVAILAAFGLSVLVAGVKIIGQAEVMVIERLGRFHRVGRSGLNLLIPFIERPRPIDVRYIEADVSGMKRITAGTTSRIDLREQVLNFPSQPVITKDNVTIDIDAVLYYRIADPQKATYAVQNLPYALENLTRTTLRNIVGEMELDQTLASRDQINRRMRQPPRHEQHQPPLGQFRWLQLHDPQRQPPPCTIDLKTDMRNQNDRAGDGGNPQHPEHRLPQK